MSSFVFISDFFVEQVLGGGELNDYEIYKTFLQKGFNVNRINSHSFSKEQLKEENFYVISNFINLKKDVKDSLKNYKYIIYEHDHKYIRSRNPALYKDFLAPKEQIINHDFYKNAIAILCQSQFHADIIYKNLGLQNIINLSGNAWSIESLEFMRQISQTEKSDKISILDTKTSHKNTHGAIKYCIQKKQEYDLVSDNNYYSFLKKLGANKKFIFLPKTPETLSRICVEARMMNMSVVVNGLIGASKEEWYILKGEELINYMMQKREKIVDTIIGLFDE